VLLTVVAGGVASDRLGRRKVFVAAAGVVMAGAALMLATTPAWTAALVAAAVLGLGFGVYTSVDFALLTEVLPKAIDRGKDLGVINIANTLPQVLAPAIAAPVVTHLGGYPVLSTVSAALGWPARSSSTASAPSGRGPDQGRPPGRTRFPGAPRARC
jgi:MFS family permease